MYVEVGVAKYAEGKKRKNGRAKTKNKKQKKNGYATPNEMTHFGAVLGLRPSTIQTCPPDLHRLHVLSFFGKSHFICRQKKKLCA
jgi:hypothetical protein